MCTFAENSSLGVGVLGTLWDDTLQLVKAAVDLFATLLLREDVSHATSRSSYFFDLVHDWNLARLTAQVLSRSRSLGWARRQRSSGRRDKSGTLASRTTTVFMRRVILGLLLSLLPFLLLLLFLGG
jgi:hypothetical protein